jgi:MFS family permease
LALIALMYGFSLLPEITGVVLILAGVAGLIAFLRWESRTANPILNVGLFQKNKAFIFSNLAGLISYTAIFAVSFLMSLYLQYIKGFTPEQAGLILVSQPVMQALLSPFTGRLSDKIEPRIIASAGMALIFAGLLLFSTLSTDTSTLQVIFTLIILGVGFALFSSPNSNAVMTAVLPKYFGVASAVMSTMRSVGQMLSMGITMIVMAVVIGRVAITPQYYPVFLNSVKIAFGIFAALCIFGILASLIRGKVR